MSAAIVPFTVVDGRLQQHRFNRGRANDHLNAIRQVDPVTAALLELLIQKHYQRDVLGIKEAAAGLLAKAQKSGA